MTVVEVTDLRKRFGPVTAVNGVSFAIAAGEVVGLLGPNGAGKTTTLHMLLGLVTPDSGTISLFGKDLARHRTEVMSRVNFAASYVGQPGMPLVGEVLVAFGYLYGLRSPRRRVDELAELLDLGPLLRRPFRLLSSGQQTWVILAKSLLNDPALLVLDEPTANLDPDVGDRIRQVLLETARTSGRAMLITSHNMREVERMCDRIHFLSSGEIVATGDATELAGAYGVADLEEVFLKVARA
jgi:ABC-2 type transport system ATP-binding protein